MYACMNCLNRLSVGAGGGAEAGFGEEGTKAGARVVGASGANMAPGSADGGVGVLESALERLLGLLDRVDLLEPLADRLESALIRLWATLWAAAPHRGLRQRDDGAIIQRIKRGAKFLVFHTGWLNRW